MERKILKWKLVEAIEVEEIRYCHNCGKKTIFNDSGKRRLNANGKELYQFAIYKCEKGHTWNCKLGIYKPGDVKTNEALIDQINYDAKSAPCIEPINTLYYSTLGIKVVEIQIEESKGRFRLDKLLAKHIQDLSRSRIERLINDGQIVVNGEKIKPNMILKKGHIIEILLY